MLLQISDIVAVSVLFVSKRPHSILFPNCFMRLNSKNWQGNSVYATIDSNIVI